MEAAVEAEVARRLAEREKQKQEEARTQEDAAATTENSRAEANTVPSGVLTPMLKRHKDLDNELMTRLQELERK